METATPLPLDEIIAAENIASLREKYADSGLKFPSERSFLRELAVAREKPIPKTVEEIPYLSVTVDNVVYDLYGVAHPPGVSVTAYGSAVKKLLDKTKGKTWAIEQSIGEYFGVDDLNNGYNPKFEMNDHIVSKVYAILLNSRIAFNMGVRVSTLPLAMLYFLLRVGVDVLREKRRRSQLSSSCLFEKTPLRVAFEKLPNHPKQVLEKYHGQINLPLEIAVIDELPTPIELELCDRNSNPSYPPLTHRRSAYMAEFLKAFRSDRDKNFLGGREHVPEIKYFLTHGVKDQRIVDLASAHAKLAEHDPEKLAKLIKQNNNQNAKIGLASLSVGLVTPPSLAYTLYQLLS